MHVSEIVARLQGLVEENAEGSACALEGVLDNATAEAVAMAVNLLARGQSVESAPAGPPPPDYRVIAKAKYTTIVLRPGVRVEEAAAVLHGAVSVSGTYTWQPEADVEISTRPKFHDCFSDFNLNARGLFAAMLHDADERQQIIDVDSGPKPEAAVPAEYSPGTVDDPEEPAPPEEDLESTVKAAESHF